MKSCIVAILRVFSPYEFRPSNTTHVLSNTSTLHGGSGGILVRELALVELDLVNYCSFVPTVIADQKLINLIVSFHAVSEIDHIQST